VVTASAWAAGVSSLAAQASSHLVSARFFRGLWSLLRKQWGYQPLRSVRLRGQGTSERGVGEVRVHAAEPLPSSPRSCPANPLPGEPPQGLSARQEEVGAVEGRDESMGSGTTWADASLGIDGCYGPAPCFDHAGPASRLALSTLMDFKGQKDADDHMRERKGRQPAHGADERRHSDQRLLHARAASPP